MENNSIYNNISIVSYDPSKTWITFANNKYTFHKRTNNLEVKSLMLMDKILQGQYIVIDKKTYTLCVPKIIKWNNEILDLTYEKGINLEFLLRFENHDLGVKILNSLLAFLLKNKIYWIDFALRNILISENQIVLVDFEKGIMDKNVSEVNFLREHIWEEYSLFLLKKERQLNLEQIFVDNSNEMIDISKISKRYYNIAKLLNYPKIITKQDYLNILKIILISEEPYIKNGKIIYPGVILDEIITSKIDNPILEYSKELIRFYDKKIKS